MMFGDGDKKLLLVEGIASIPFCHFVSISISANADYADTSIRLS